LILLLGYAQGPGFGLSAKQAMFRHRRSAIFLDISGRRLNETSEQSFADGKSEGIFKDSEREYQFVGCEI
jgi:hypothetical protein